MRNNKINLSQIERVVDIIQQMNKMIRIHKAAEKPDILAIEQYEEIKQKAVREMLTLLSQLDIAEATIEYFKTYMKGQAA